MQDELLANRTAIVTGAGSGIGKAIANRFAVEGAVVVVADSNEVTGRETVEAIESSGGTGLFVEMDVTQSEQVGTLVETVVDEYGSIDVLVNNAGGSAVGDGNLHQVDERTWDESVELNMKGPFLCANKALPAMVQNGGGSMVHISSVNGTRGIAKPAYSAAKGGLISLSRLIATQYGRHGIRSNVICPGTITTKPGAEKDIADERYPIGRYGRPEEIASTALFLASKEASFITGTEVVADGGITAGFSHTMGNRATDIDGVRDHRRRSVRPDVLSALRTLWERITE